MKTRYSYVIVGAGAAGTAAARAIRQEDPQAPLLVISNEDRFPYHRTQLSKNLVHGFERDQFALEDAGFWEPAGIDLLTDVQVIGIDPETKTLALSNGSEFSYERLLLATGGRPRLSSRYGIDTDELTVLRTAEEAEALILTASSATSAVVAGDGVLAVELADQLAQRGLQVVLGTRGTRLMQKRLSPRASELLQQELSALEIKLVMQSELVRVEQNRPGVPLPKLSVSLGGGVSHGEGEFHADIVAVAYGIEPDVSLASDAGIETDRGIQVNKYLETSVSDIYAAGDCAQHPDGSLTGVWRAADAQGTLAARNMIADSNHDQSGRKAWDNPVFRLKFTANGKLFCTVNVPQNPAAFQLHEVEQNGIYQAWYVQDGIVKGSVSVGDPDRMQDYEDAVRYELSLDDALKKLAVS
ncbi:NAD(P)/FAD-dependent oxidoreductase [Spirochaeta dissipatitropha]